MTNSAGAESSVGIGCWASSVLVADCDAAYFTGTKRTCAWEGGRCVGRELRLTVHDSLNKTSLTVEAMARKC